MTCLTVLTLRHDTQQACLEAVAAHPANAGLHFSGLPLTSMQAMVALALVQGLCGHGAPLLLYLQRTPSQTAKQADRAPKPL